MREVNGPQQPEMVSTAPLYCWEQQLLRVSSAVVGAKRAIAEEEDGNVLPGILLKTKLIFRGREDGGGMKQEAIASQSAKQPYSATPELLFTKRCRRRVTS